MANDERKVESLLSEQEIRQRVCALGGEIARDFAGRDITVVSVLTGSLIFTADLIRQLDAAVVRELQWITARSYARGTEPGPLEADFSSVKAEAIRGHDVLIVDDILDSGQTLNGLTERLHTMQPQSLRTVVLLEKQGRQRPEFPVTPDYVGFRIPDRFVVGYGMDLAGRYRNLPYIGVVDEPPDEIAA